MHRLLPLRAQACIRRAPHDSTRRQPGQAALCLWREDLTADDSLRKKMARAKEYLGILQDSRGHAGMSVYGKMGFRRPTSFGALELPQKGSV